MTVTTDDLLAAARRLVNTIPCGEGVTVDLCAYNDLRDALRLAGVLDAD